MLTVKLYDTTGVSVRLYPVEPVAVEPLIIYLFTVDATANVKLRSFVLDSGPPLNEQGGATTGLGIAVATGYSKDFDGATDTGSDVASALGFSRDYSGAVTSGDGVAAANGKTATYGTGSSAGGCLLSFEGYTRHFSGGGAIGTGIAVGSGYWVTPSNYVLQLKQDVEIADRYSYVAITYNRGNVDLEEED